MRYTITKLSKLSGVSSRTLRFYDEINLLKPAFYGDNQYRYYEEEQLLMLQQILFFRELGFPLNDIQRIISSDDFDKIEALTAHKSTLQSNLERTETLIDTIDKTLSHLRGNLTMRDKEMYVGFDAKKQKEYEEYLIDQKIITQKEVNKYRAQVKHWKKEDWEKHKEVGDELNAAFLAALQEHLQPADLRVQAIVSKHHAWIKNFWLPTRKTYIELGRLYQTHPDFRAFYEAYDPKLVDYIFAAMKVFATNELGD